MHHPSGRRPARNGRLCLRIDALDLARGIAVLGIVVINMEGFAGPFAAVGNPDWNGEARVADFLSFSVAALFFEGKMRALFTLLFGAGIVFFAARRSPGGDAGDGAAMAPQLRRLGWLAVFGYLHYLVLWRGDILFLYAVAGTCALAFLRLSALRLIVAGLLSTLIFGAYCTWGVGPIMIAIDAAAHGHASAEQIASLSDYTDGLSIESAADRALFSSGMAAQIGHRLTSDPFYPLLSLKISVFETLPLMLLGMGLAKGGFFTGAVSRSELARIGWAGCLLGLVWAALSLAWLFHVGFSRAATPWLFYYTGLPGRMAMALGYLAIVVRYAPAWMETALGRRFAAAGRMAFTNYIATSLVMTFVFHGWGLGLIERDFGHGGLMVFAGAMGVAMLTWSAPWLRRFGSGPLELLWRRLALLGASRRKRD
ncbi:DUF418 domain-containing protein [Croceicoccus sp. YJ47]|uniref:DUF418 domain-containing protein n=1 Tax=Croceicoccus sp. YJ47 TaxID=2798724 RepID=UPI0019207A14|nr:DUF418 domain-containing protein [Croceicoccus sp. YJ47]QQN74881.1 DUF418 domain-containing protein [Croceicoccus sp. YJ47]